MNDRVSQAVNTLVVLDEYKNDLDIRKIAYLKGLWGGGGQTKKNTKTGQADTGYGTLHPCHLPCLLQNLVQPNGEKALRRFGGSLQLGTDPSTIEKS